MPLTEEQIAAIQAERDARVDQYWGVPAAPTPGPVAGYQPNPGLPNYQPNPAAPVGGAPAVHRAPIGASPPVPVSEQGAFSRAFNSSEPLFQVPSAPKPPPFQPDPNAIDLDTDPAVVGSPDAIDLDVPDPNAPVRQPQGFQREMVSGRPVGPMARPVRAAGSGNPDPYGIGAARKGLLDTYDTRASALQQIQTAEADKAAVIGDQQAELARRRSEDASIAMMEQQYATEHFDQKMTEFERQLGDVASKKIDPQRLMKETPGLGFLAIIGGAIGGFYQGLTRSGENPFLKELNIMIDRDIAAQEKEIDTGIRGANQQMGLLAQQRAIFQDAQQARMAAQVLYYQSAEDQLMAEAARYDQPIYKARAEEAAAQIQAEKQALMLKIAEQQRAQSAAAAGAMYARDKEVRAMRNDIYDKVLGATGNPAMAEAEADRQVAISYGLRNQVPDRSASGGFADPLSLVPKDQRSEAVKEFQAYANKRNVVSAIGKSFQDWRDTSAVRPSQLNSTRSAIAGTIMANVPGIRSDVDFKEIVEPNLPERFDTEETLRHKEATIRQFVESKTVTPILDAHAPGWRQPTGDEQRAAFGATRVGAK